MPILDTMLDTGERIWLVADSSNEMLDEAFHSFVCDPVLRRQKKIDRMFLR